MPADASIYSQIRPFQMDDPLTMTGKALAIQSAQHNVEEGRRKFQLEDDISGALSQSGGDLGKASNLLSQQGRGTAALQLRDKASAAEKSDVDRKLKLWEHAGAISIGLDQAYRQALQKNNGDQAAAMAEIQPIWQQSRLQAKELGLNLPEQFDPQKNFAGISTAKNHVEYFKTLNPTPSEIGKLTRERDALPQGDPRRATYDAAIAKASTHQPATTVNVSGEKKYTEHFASKVAEGDVSMRDTAMKATDLATRANDVLSVLGSGKVITGSGAEARLAIGKALNLAGASDAETISNTEQLATGLAQNTLDAIKASGLGAGSGFSNADRDFLEKAVGGKITLEASTIKRLATLSHRAAEKSAEKWNKRVGEIPNSALEGTGITREPIKVPGISNTSQATDPRSVTLPNGRVKTFPTPAAAQRFKEEAGL